MNAQAWSMPHLFSDLLFASVRFWRGYNLKIEMLLIEIDFELFPAAFLNFNLPRVVN